MTLAVLYTTPVAFEHTVALPAITGVGFALMVTLYKPVVTAQVVAVIVSVNCNVPAPAAPHVTVMLLLPAPPVITPPAIAHT